MMSCQNARDLLSPLLDDELPLGERCGLEAHLATCAECAEQERALAALDDALLALPRLSAPPSLLARIEAGAEELEVAAGPHKPTTRIPLPAGWTRWAPTHSIAATVAAALLSLLGVVEVASWVGDESSRPLPSARAVAERRAPPADLAARPAEDDAAPFALESLEDALVAVAVETAPIELAAAAVPLPVSPTSPEPEPEPAPAPVPVPAPSTPAVAARPRAAAEERRLGLYPLVSASEDGSLTPAAVGVAAGPSPLEAELALATDLGGSGASLRLSPEAGLGAHRDALAAAAGLGIPVLLAAVAVRDERPATPVGRPALGGGGDDDTLDATSPIVALGAADRRRAPHRLLPAIPLLAGLADERLRLGRDDLSRLDRADDGPAPVLAVALLF